MQQSCVAVAVRILVSLVAELDAPGAVAGIGLGAGRVLVGLGIVLLILGAVAELEQVD